MQALQAQPRPKVRGSLLQLNILRIIVRQRVLLEGGGCNRGDPSVFASTAFLMKEIGASLVKIFGL